MVSLMHLINKQHQQQQALNKLSQTLGWNPRLPHRGHLGNTSICWPFQQSKMELDDLANIFKQLVWQVLPCGAWRPTYKWEDSPCYPTCKLECGRPCIYPVQMLHEWLNEPYILSFLRSLGKVWLIRICRYGKLVQNKTILGPQRTPTCLWK